VSLPAIAVSNADGIVLVPSRLFGPLHVRSDSFITFPDGLLGFAGERRFILLPAAPEGVFWLQAVDDGSLVFLLVDPFPVFPDYAFDLPAAADLEPGSLAVLSIVTLPRDASASATTNLQAPLVIDLASRTGRQEVLVQADFGTQQPFDLKALLGQ
jgi:flagellar assembly factor FliW